MTENYADYFRDFSGKHDIRSHIRELDLLRLPWSGLRGVQRWHDRCSVRSLSILIGEWGHMYTKGTMLTSLGLRTGSRCIRSGE